MTQSIMKNVTPIQQLMVVQNVVTDEGDVVLQKVETFLHSKGVMYSVAKVGYKDRPDIDLLASQTDMVVVLGGDGTLLRTAQCFVPQHIPVVGVNTGTLGFLARIDPSQVEEYLGYLLAGEYSLEHRMMLSVGHDKQGSEKLALNDVVIKNADPSRMATLRFSINNRLVAIYDADGLILSTPTGSTAYTISAGGPVISPEIEAIAVTPICPHSLSAKPVVLPASKVLSVESTRKNKEVRYAVDGQDVGVLKPGEGLTVTQASVALPMVRFHKDGNDFYRLLKNKLHWAENPRKKMVEVY